jgi:adenylosuccinate lyase
MALVKAGADRQEMHERIRLLALKAWETFSQRSENPLMEELCHDAKLLEYLSEQEIRFLMEARPHVGDAPQRARALAKSIQEIVKIKEP